MPVISRFNYRYLICFIVLLPCTLCIGSFFLWLWRRSFVSRIDERGVTLWSGRHEPWRRVRGYQLRKKLEASGPSITRVDMQFVIGRAFVSPGWLQNGDEVMEAFRIGFRDRVAPGRRRSSYRQRR